MKSIVAWTTNNRVFANLLMAVLILLGVISLYQIKSELVPRFSLDRVQVRVVWEGASPEEVEEGACIKVEEAITGIEGVKTITSTAIEHSCQVIAELESWVKEARIVMDDIKNAVDRIDTFSSDIDRPVVSEIKRIDQVLDLALYGNVSELALKRMAEEIKDELVNIPGISQVIISGLRDWEISIDVSEATLRRHGLTFDQLANTIRKNVLELSGGDIRSADQRIRIRTLGKRYTGPEFENLEILTQKDGTILRLKDIARVVDGFEDNDKSGRFNGKPAALIVINKTEDEDSLDIAEKVRAYAAQKQQMLPDGMALAPLGGYLEDDQRPSRSPSPERPDRPYVGFPFPLALFKHSPLILGGDGHSSFAHGCARNRDHGERFPEYDHNVRLHHGAGHFGGRRHCGGGKHLCPDAKGGGIYTGSGGGHDGSRLASRRDGDDHHSRFHAPLLGGGYHWEIYGHHSGGHHRGSCGFSG